MPGNVAYDLGLRRLHEQDYVMAVNWFRLADKKLSRTLGADSDDVLAARALKARGYIELKRFREADQLLADVLLHMGDRIAVRDVDRATILQYQKLVNEALAGR